MYLFNDSIKHIDNKNVLNIVYYSFHIYILYVSLYMV